MTIHATREQAIADGIRYVQAAAVRSGEPARITVCYGPPRCPQLGETCDMCERILIDGHGRVTRETAQ